MKRKFTFLISFIVFGIMLSHGTVGISLPTATDTTHIPETNHTKGFALLHFYRFNSIGTFIGFDIHLGDTVLCRAKNHWKQTVKTTIDGRNTIWAKTEARSEIPVNIKPGEEYYIRCNTTMGIMVARPKLELVDKDVGKIEYETLKSYKKYLRKQKRERRREERRQRKQDKK